MSISIIIWALYDIFFQHFEFKYNSTGILHIFNENHHIENQNVFTLAKSFNMDALLIPHALR